jgi:dihydrodipicolinate synthase/N-acetylneuraminate lyase
VQEILPSGVYPPLPTFFDEFDELDLATLRHHMRHVADSGIAGYVLMGSNGEAVHLSDVERTQVIETAKEVVGSSGNSLPLIAGCGALSTRATIGYCRQAAQSGASFALVLPPSYFRGRMDTQALIAHYRAVADSSPLPVILYNMPDSAAGIDLDAATVCVLAEHPNIVGIKDSSGNVAKITQIVANVPETFQAFVGSASNLLPALVVGAVGAVAALANVFPHEVSMLQALFEADEMEEARTLQARLIPANSAVTTVFGVAGLKAALEMTAGYGGKPRMPLQPLGEQERRRLFEILHAVPQDE